MTSVLPIGGFQSIIIALIDAFGGKLRFLSLLFSSMGCIFREIDLPSVYMGDRVENSNLSMSSNSR